jgi:hypothetical protein
VQFDRVRAAKTPLLMTLAGASHDVGERRGGLRLRPPAMRRQGSNALESSVTGVAAERHSRCAGLRDRADTFSVPTHSPICDVHRALLAKEGGGLLSRANRRSVLHGPPVAYLGPKAVRKEELVKILRAASATVVSSVFCVGMLASPAQAQEQDGLVNVVIGDVTILEDVNVGVAAQVAANVCGVKVGPVAVLGQAVDRSGRTETVCTTEQGPVTLRQN